jgi:hypothetical protein
MGLNRWLIFVMVLALSSVGQLAVAQTPEQAPATGAAPASDAPMPPAPAPPAESPPPLPPPAPIPSPPAAPPSAPITLTPLAPPAAASPSLTPTMSKFSATIYGFVEADSIFDSTQSFNDLAGNAVILHTPAPTTATPNPTLVYGAEHGRTTFSARNSRFGVKLKGPETDTVKTSGIFECDFLGNQPQGSPAPAGSPAVTEGSFYTSPTFRMRHYALKLETPYIDVLAGQYWQLFGFQSLFHPNTVEMQGVPGQIYSRSPQFRISHVFKSDAVNVELAGAASRPPQRDSEVPDGQAGIRLAINNWKGMHTAGAAGSAIDALSIGFSTVGRYFKVPNLSGAPTQAITINGYGYSVDALIPIIPASDVNRPDNALTLTGSFVYGQAIADLYTGLNGGAGMAAPPANAMGVAQTYPQDVDNGLISFTSDGVLHAIRWESVIAGLQYYLPTPNRAWISANYSHMYSSDIKALLTSSNGSKMFNKSDWVDGNVFVEANSAVRFGLEYAYFHQSFLDGSKGKNSRVQFSAFYIF